MTKKPSCRPQAVPAYDDPVAPTPLLNCPKCRQPLAMYLEVCPACGVVIAAHPSVDRPSEAR